MAGGVDGTSSYVLNHINVTSLSNDECQESTGVWQGSTVSYNGHIKDNMMCARGSDQDACKGDSGGPMIVAGSSAAGDVQVGIISWGLGCATESFPGVYSRISWEYNWIASNMCEMLSDPLGYFGCPSPSEASTSDADMERDVVVVDHTIAIESDAFPEDTSYVLEVDRDASADAGAGWTTTTATTTIDGDSHVPLGTFASGLVAKMAQNKVY